jgi:plasmid stabilization system protein ParE
MAFRTFVSECAEVDVEDSFDWYESRQVGLGDRFLIQVRLAIQAISTNPFAYQIRAEDYRQAIVKGFPFVVVFIIEEDWVLIESIFHTSRDPSQKFD